MMRRCPEADVTRIIATASGASVAAAALCSAAAAVGYRRQRMYASPVLAVARFMLSNCVSSLVCQFVLHNCALFGWGIVAGHALPSAVTGRWRRWLHCCWMPGPCKCT